MALAIWLFEFKKNICLLPTSVTVGNKSNNNISVKQRTNVFPWKMAAVTAPTAMNSNLQLHQYLNKVVVMLVTVCVCLSVKTGFLLITVWLVWRFKWFRYQQFLLCTYSFLFLWKVTDTITAMMCQSCQEMAGLWLVTEKNVPDKNKKPVSLNHRPDWCDSVFALSNVHIPLVVSWWCIQYLCPCSHLQWFS